jgi:hypothetical protein
MTGLMTPTYAKNMRIIGHTDQGGGRADGVQIMIHRGHAYVGHIFSKGVFPLLMYATRQIPGRRNAAHDQGA